MTADAAVEQVIKPVVAWFDHLTLKITGNARNRDDPERGQALTRIIIVPLFDVYMVAAIAWEGIATPSQWTFIFFMQIYVPVSFLLLWHIVRWPGNYPGRRLLAMFGDYGAMTFAFSVGEMATLPVFATLLWVTVGNGMRYGSGYLLLATAMAMASVAIATLFNDHWRGEPYIVITLVLTLLIVPAYINGLQKALRQALNEAREANTAKSNFLAQASHDLRQPIHAMSLFIACLRDAGLGPEERSMVENIDRSLHSVSRLFRSLLDISTLDSGKVEPKPRPIAVGDLLADIARQNSQAAEWAKATLRVVRCKCYVNVDDVLLTTMVQNVVTNALKYAPGAPVLIGCRRRRGRLAIEVYDRGPGIAEEHLPHVFEEFYQVRERGDRDIEGVGLGLPIVRRIGRLMGLTVTIRSKPGGGTTVIIDGLHVVPAPPAPARQRHTTLPSTATNGLRVLLVEDDPNVLQATATLLQKWGCIVQAETAPPARIENCDVLITDFDLGAKRTGADCIALVRELARRDVPAIVMSGHDETRVRQDLEDPSIPILGKPVRPAAMRSVLTSVMLRTESESAS